MRGVFEISLVFSRWPLISSKCQTVSGPFTAFSIFKRLHSSSTHLLHVTLLVVIVLLNRSESIPLILIFNFHLIYGSEWAVIRELVSLSIEAREFKTLATAQQKELGFRINSF